MSGYTKLFPSILDSTVWDTSLATKVVWITLLAMADRDGFVSASVPGLAKRAGVTREQCGEALAFFLAPDPDSRTRDHDGRRIAEVEGGWRLLNAEKYREKSSIEERREKDAARQQRKRERAASRDNHAPSRDVTDDHATVTPCPSASTMSRHAEATASASTEATAHADPERAREPIAFPTPVGIVEVALVAALGAARPPACLVLRNGDTQHLADAAAAMKAADPRPLRDVAAEWVPDFVSEFRIRTPANLALYAQSRAANGGAKTTSAPARGQREDTTPVAGAVKGVTLVGREARERDEAIARARAEMVEEPPDLVATLRGIGRALP